MPCEDPAHCGWLQALLDQWKLSDVIATGDVTRSAPAPPLPLIFFFPHAPYPTSPNPNILQGTPHFLLGGSPNHSDLYFPTKEALNPNVPKSSLLWKHCPRKLSNSFRGPLNLSRHGSLPYPRTSFHPVVNPNSPCWVDLTSPWNFILFLGEHQFSLQGSAMFPSIL